MWASYQKLCGSNWRGYLAPPPVLSVLLLPATHRLVRLDHGSGALHVGVHVDRLAGRRGQGCGGSRGASDLSKVAEPPPFLAVGGWCRGQMRCCGWVGSREGRDGGRQRAAASGYALGQSARAPRVPGAQGFRVQGFKTPTHNSAKQALRGRTPHAAPPAMLQRRGTIVCVCVGRRGGEKEDQRRWQQQGQQQGCRTFSLIACMW